MPSLMSRSTAKGISKKNLIEQQYSPISYSKYKFTYGLPNSLQFYSGYSTSSEIMSVTYSKSYKQYVIFGIF